MPCEILDLRCIFVNEIVGDVGLAIMLAVVIYFIVASKLKFGFDTTIYMGIPILLIFGLGIGQFSLIFILITIVVGLMAAWIFNKTFGN